MTVGLLCGLLLSAGLYVLAIYGSVWAGKRRIAWALARGVQLGPEPRFPRATEIWTGHRVDMTVTYALCFTALALAGFSIWERLAFAALSALVFGWIWIANLAPNELPIASWKRNMTEKTMYGCLLFACVFGYMATLCFATGLVVAAL